MARPRLHQPDFTLIAITALLVGFGLIMLYSAGAVVGYERFGHPDYFFRRQLFSLVVGVGLFLFFALIDYHLWRRFAVPLLLGSLVLLLLVFLPGIGFSAGGARRWIQFGGFLLQPSEVVKLTFVVYLAVWLEKHGKGIRDFFYGLMPFLVVLGLIVGLIMLQPDLGTVIAIFVTSLAVYFAGGAPKRYLALILAGSVALFTLLVKIAPYRASRLTVFLNPELDPQGIGYHINQALLAIGTGGLFGVGLGHSRQKYNYLPEVTGDSIFAVIAEELGLFGVLALLGLFLAFFLRGIAISRAAPDTFGRLLAVGVTAGIILQALINMAALSGVLPLTGITLPFISYGGSSLIMSLAAVGLLVNVSRQTRAVKQ